MLPVPSLRTIDSRALVGHNQPANHQHRRGILNMYMHVPSEPIGRTLGKLTSLVGGPGIHLPELVLLLKPSWSKDKSRVPNVLAPTNTSFLVSNKSSKRRPALEIHVLCPYTMSITHNGTHNTHHTTPFFLACLPRLVRKNRPDEIYASEYVSNVLPFAGHVGSYRLRAGVGH